MLMSIIAFIILLLDQSTKHYVLTRMSPSQTIPVFQNYFHITFVKNAGAAFGIFQNQRIFFILITVVVVIIILLAYWKLARDQNIYLTIALGLQLGGALGNFIDRVRFGYVIDFLDFRIWPVFNVADMAIVGGVILLIWQILVNPGRIG